LETFSGKKLKTECIIIGVSFKMRSPFCWTMMMMMAAMIQYDVTIH